MTRYIHILWPNELKFLKPLVEMINNPSLGFDSNDHLFVTPHRDVKNALYSFSNVIFDDSGVNLINKYADECVWLFSHDLTGIRQTLQIKRKYLKKIVWRTWGGSHQRYNYSKGFFFERLAHFIEDWLYKKYYNLYFGKGIIGIANSVDEIDLRKWLPSTVLIPLPYIGSNQYDNLVKVKQEKVQTNIKPRIMVGHQGTEAEHHIDIISKLLKYDASEFDIYVPLSYGTETYMNNLERELSEMKVPNLVIVKKFFKYEDYCRFLNSMDLIILDEVSSMALGNLSIILFLQKKIMLNKQGILREVFDKYSIPYLTSDILPSANIKSLFEPILYDGTNNDMVLHEYTYYVEQWHAAISFLENHRD